MLNRLRNFILIKLGKTSVEELTIKACIEQGMKVGKKCHGLAASTIDVAHCWLIKLRECICL